MPWTTLAAVVRGAGHIRLDTPCQDACAHAVLESPGGEVLAIAVSDGAGSAPLSQIGSALACTTLLDLARDALATETLESLTEGTLVGWFGQVHAVLAREAHQRHLSLRALACTLLLVLAGETRTIYAQVGDGSLVAEEDGTLIAVFWPQAGEYVNTTNFVTEIAFERALEVEIRGPVNRLAAMTDGLQRLVLRFADKSVHQPFLAPMFATLEARPDDPALAAALAAFLDSTAVNQRTDDDKTLCLAVRRRPELEAERTPQDGESDDDTLDESRR